MLHLMAIVSGSDQPLSSLRSEVERYASSGEINFEVDDPEAAMRRVEEAAAGAAIDRLDGLTVDYGAGWFNLRPSNTEPLLRLNAEAKDKKTLASCLDKVSPLLGRRVAH